MASNDTGSLTIYDIKKEIDHLRSFMKSHESMKGLPKQQTLNEPKFI